MELAEQNGRTRFSRTALMQRWSVMELQVVPAPLRLSRDPSQHLSFHSLPHRLLLSRRPSRCHCRSLCLRFHQSQHLLFLASASQAVQNTTQQRAQHWQQPVNSTASASVFQQEAAQQQQFHPVALASPTIRTLITPLLARLWRQHVNSSASASAFPLSASRHRCI